MPDAPLFRNNTRLAIVGCLAAALLCASPVRADDDDDEAADNAPAKLGVVHDNLRRAKKQQSMSQTVSDDYAGFKTRMEDEHGLTWSFGLSYRQAWVHPDNIGTSSQTLFWPTVNWDMFTNDSIGSGSFQLFYYGQQRSSARVTASRGRRTLSTELPESAQRYSQFTYTHTLPGEKLAVIVGEFSFFNFDNNEFMASQQLNFITNIFSANGSATYPTTGFGGLVQFNATKTLQFLAGGQSVNTVNTAKPPSDGYLSSPYAWLGYAQWTPAFKGLGDAQYSLTLYQAPATSERPASHGWSINAVQNLNDRWAVFGRLNASSDDGGGHKRSVGVGAALNNPLGRAAADQIGIAIGSVEQKLPLSAVTLEHTQNTLEGYWNWSFIGGLLLLTPDVQYIRKPLFAPERDSAWIMSLRTALVF